MITLCRNTDVFIGETVKWQASLKSNIKNLALWFLLTLFKKKIISCICTEFNQKYSFVGLLSGGHECSSCNLELLPESWWTNEKNWSYKPVHLELNFKAVWSIFVHKGGKIVQSNRNSNNDNNNNRNTTTISYWLTWQPKNAYTTRRQSNISILSEWSWCPPDEWKSNTLAFSSGLVSPTS